MVLFGPINRLTCWIGGGILTAAVTCTVVLCVLLLPADNKTPVVARNLLHLSAAERRAYLASFDLILSDCDGTVWDLTASIPGASDGVAALQALPGKRIVFVSNNALRSDENYLRRFAAEGINATMADVVHPGIIIVDYLQQTGFTGGLIYAIGSENLRRYLIAGGQRLVDGESRAQIEDSFEAILRHAQDGLPVKAVVLDWDNNLEFKELLRAESYLNADPECELLFGATDMRLPFPRTIMGPGTVQRLMEEVTGRTGRVLSKPGEAMRDVVMQKFGVTDARRILFVGDTLEQDIGFGKRSGFQTLAVLTGSASLESIENVTDADLMPDFYLPSFADFVEVCRDA